MVSTNPIQTYSRSYSALLSISRAQSVDISPPNEAHGVENNQKKDEVFARLLAARQFGGDSLAMCG